MLKYRTLPVRSIIPPRLEAVIRSRLGVSAPSPEDAPSSAGGRDPSDIREGSFHARRRRREKHVDAPHVMLSDAEINRALRRYRFDRQFRGPRRVPIKTLADFIGLSHETLFQAMRGSVSDRTRAKLSWAIVAIDEGRLSFRRNGQQWKCEITEGIARR